MPPKRKFKSTKMDTRKTRQPVSDHPNPNPAPASETEKAATRGMNEALESEVEAKLTPPNPKSHGVLKFYNTDYMTLVDIYNDKIIKKNRLSDDCNNLWKTATTAEERANAAERALEWKEQEWEEALAAAEERAYALCAVQQELEV